MPRSAKKRCQEKHDFANLLRRSTSLFLDMFPDYSMYKHDFQAYLYRQYLTSDGLVGDCGRPPPLPQISMLESRISFYICYWLRLPNVATTLKFRGRGRPTPGRLKLSIDEGWSVQHVGRMIFAHLRKLWNARFSAGPDLNPRTPDLHFVIWPSQLGKNWTLTASEAWAQQEDSRLLVERGKLAPTSPTRAQLEPNYSPTRAQAIAQL